MFSRLEAGWCSLAITTQPTYTRCSGGYCAHLLFSIACLCPKRPSLLALMVAHVKCRGCFGRCILEFAEVALEDASWSFEEVEVPTLVPSLVRLQQGQTHLHGLQRSPKCINRWLCRGLCSHLLLSILSLLDKVILSVIAQDDKKPVLT